MLLNSKRNNKQNGRQSMEWQKIFLNHISHKKLLSNIYKEFGQLNSKTTKNSIKNLARALNRYFFSKKI